LAQTSLGAVLPLPLTSIWRTEISVKERVLIRIKVHKGIGARVTAYVLFSYHQFSSTHSVKYIYMHIYILSQTSPGSVHCMSMLYIACTQNFSSKLLRMSERLLLELKL
jgi:hypothetical protein